MRTDSGDLRGLIRKQLMIALVVGILLTALFLLVVMTKSFEESFMASLKGEARVIADLLEAGGTPALYDDLPIRRGSNRVTLVNPKGVVIFDSMADAVDLENHSDRPEIMEAFSYGESTYIRHSETLGVNYYYYALRLPNHEGVLRVSATADMPNRILMQNGWQIVMILLGILFLADRLSKNLALQMVRPFEKMDLENLEQSDFVYAELQPFRQKIVQQKNQLADSMASLQERADIIETITENMGEGLLLLDAEGQVVTANKGFYDIMGITQPLPLPQKLIYLTRHPMLSKGAKAVLSGERFGDLLHLNHRYYQVMGGAVEGGGGIILLSDITAREKASILRREFTANVSHELRTPLTSISGYGELLKLGMVQPQDVMGFGEKIHNESLRLLALIEQMMKLSRLDEQSGDKDRQFVPVSLRKISRTTIHLLLPLGQEKSIHLSLEDGDGVVMGDEQMLTDLVYNLCENAIKYNKVGGKVTISIKNQEKGCTLSVTDTGIGIPSQGIERIFERFYRVDQSRGGKISGSGLGLSIVKHIVEYHHGTLSVESKLGEGTTITVVL